jgi:hypothetical protein
MGYIVKYREQAFRLQDELIQSDGRFYPAMEIIKALINYQGDREQTIAWLRSDKWRRGKKHVP